MSELRFTRAEDLPKAVHKQTGAVNPAPLVGTWLNTDKASPGIVKLILSARDGALVVRAFGACKPSPCDWGEVDGLVYSDGVDSNEGMAFTASYRFGFLETILAVYLKSGILVLDSFNAFKDDSGRSDYFSREFFYQQEL
jgi:hypothetical protein